MRLSHPSIVLILCVLGTRVATAQAQVSETAYATIVAGAGASITTDYVALDQDWSPETGAVVFAATPFYVGRLNAQARYQPFSARGAVPSFRTFAVRVGWDRELVSLGPLSARAGAAIGTLRMSFDDRSEPGIRNESELLLAASGKLLIRIRRNSGLHLGWTRERVFTRVPLDLGHWSVSYAHTFRTPDWIGRIIE